MIKGHASIIGETGYNCHSRHFFKELDKLIPVQVRNFTIGSSWEGYNNDEPHNNEYYIDDQLKTMLVEQTLHTPNGRENFPLYTRYKNEGTPNIHIVLNETNHHYFYDEYDGIKIAYNVWETTRQPEDFFERLKQFDQVWVPTEWQRQCTIEQGISQDKVKVVPEGVDVDMYKPKNRIASMPTNRPFRFLLVGRWDYRKSTREIIESFVNTFSEDENVEMILSIDNPYAKDGLNSTEERLEKFGIRHKGLKLVHHLSKEEYANMIKTCDVFVSCARGEGWNLPLIEAMSSGVPSLYSNWGAQLEFAQGKGIPVDISYERPAKIESDDFTWNWDAPGMFVEPNFNDLSHKMRDVYQNFSIHKRKALDDSDEIREKFTWKNAAKRANQIIEELTNTQSVNQDVVSVVITRADTPEKKKLLRECISALDTEVILSTNYPVESDVLEMVDYFIYSKENPILLKDEYEEHNVAYYKWYLNENGEKIYSPFEFEHGYAAYLLTRRGVEYAKSLNKKIVHIINYDYEISKTTLRENENFLNDGDVVFYIHDDWEFEGHNVTFCSAFISGKIEPLMDYFTKYDSRRSYYLSKPGWNILEANLTDHFKNGCYKLIERTIGELKLNNKVNQAGAENMENGALLHTDKSFKQLSDLFDCDKTVYHKYDKHYPKFLEKWRTHPINIFEIGFDEGKSMNVWQNYFPYAKIWGMDITKEFKNNKCHVFLGDQSKIEDLRRIQKQVPLCKLIIDDGSHVPDHQMKSFYYLFQNMLDWGGIYIIEDTECSYWGPDKEVYGFETGYLNLIDYFTKFNHQVNGHYNLMKNELNIESITYTPNCIIIQKKEKDDAVDNNYRFKDRLSDSPNYKEMDFQNNIMKNRIDVNFIDGAFVEIIGNEQQKYLIKFIDKSTNLVVFESKIENNQWTRTNRKWFTNWKIEIHSDENAPIVYEYDAKNKRVFIVFESSSLGDTIAWMPYVEEFRKKHNCHVIVSTFLNHLFKDQYPELEFVNRGVKVDNLYALYKIGCFYDDNGVDMSRHKTDFRKLRLQEYASDTLGLDFYEILPRMPQIEPIKTEKPYICIANHSTAQSKYWNNPNGWQELVDYVKSIGYDVYLLSKEEDGYMGNKNPNGVIKVENKTLEEIGSILLGSKCFIGISSGLSWLAWSLGVETILISGQTDKLLEPVNNIHRVINESVCHACFSRYLFDRGDWNWCPDHKGTERQFECSKEIPFSMVQPKIDKILSI